MLSLGKLKGVGPKTEKLLTQAGLCTALDLLTYYPKNYQALELPGPVSDAAEGQTAAFCGCFIKDLSVRHIPGKTLVTGIFETTGGERLQAVWFNMPYLRTSVKSGVPRVIRGRVTFKGRTLCLNQPSLYDPEEYERLRANLQPVYPLTAGLTENLLRKLMKQIFDGAGDPSSPIHRECAALFEEYLPAQILEKWGLLPLGEAMYQIHFPDNEEKMLSARARLVFDEFLLFILRIRMLKEKSEVLESDYPLPKADITRIVIASLPYKMTGAQERTWKTIEEELSQTKVMNRLVQGDVGSGKTIIAFLAMLQCAAAGRQAALMVPTEVLARQHYEAFLKLTRDFMPQEKTVLLTGSSKAAERRSALAAIKDGTAAVIIGTHALIQEAVDYQALSLVITDEQHRFGVKQRGILSMKGKVPHVLVMSATPIPRTLAVIIYGDLDISVIDEMPKNRLPVKNCVIGPDRRESAYRFIASQAEMGHQVYVICPMVEESEVMEGENVVDYTQLLTRRFPDLRVGMLHGKMKNDEKNKIMQEFADGKIQVLCSTTVVEVGVNVPSATVMMIENAERFGLSQLHQLRGRVGRGEDQSYCILVDGSGHPEKNKRLGVLVKSNNGFEIASADLAQRGPGDLFGIRQSGILDFSLGDIYNDADILQKASQTADEILSKVLHEPGDDYRMLYEKITSDGEILPQNMNI